MLRCFYIPGTGMVTQRERMNVIINNITNVDTTGYKSDVVLSRSFSDMLLERYNDPNLLGQREEVGPLSTGIHVDEVYTMFENGGPIEQTDELTDVAITGDGFFCVETAEGERYTRSGSFQRNQFGDLLTKDGQYVLGYQGRVNVGTGDFYISSDGSVFVDGQVTNRLRVAQFQDVEGLRKQGNNLYYHLNNEVPANMQNAAVLQGALEGSNVDVGYEMSSMMMTSRAYESNQRMLKMVDATIEKLLEVGR